MVLWGNWAAEQWNDTLNFTKMRSCVLEGNPRRVSWDDASSKTRNTLPNGTLPFYVTFCASSASWSHDAVVSWWRWEAAAVRQQYFQRLRRSLNGLSSGGNDLGQPQNHCSLHLDGNSHTGPHFPSISICAALPVFVKAGARLNHHLPRCGMFISVSLCTQGYAGT